MAIEIVDFPIKNGDFPVRYVKLLEGIWIRKWFPFLWWLYIYTYIPWYARESPCPSWFTPLVLIQHFKTFLLVINFIPGSVCPVADGLLYALVQAETVVSFHQVYSAKTDVGFHHKHWTSFAGWNQSFSWLHTANNATSAGIFSTWSRGPSLFQQTFLFRDNPINWTIYSMRETQ